MPLRLRSLILLLTLACSTALHTAGPEFLTRVFKFPSDYASRDWAYGDSDPPVDPFAAHPLPQRKIVREYLEKQGVVFPEGASATYNPLSGLLSVTNTEPNLSLVEAISASFTRRPPLTITCVVTIVEGPGELIRQANAAASRTMNAAQPLTTLLSYAKNSGSNVRVVGDAFLETRSGLRATTAAVRDHACTASPEMDAQSRASVTQQRCQTGLRLEYEPTLDTDGKTIGALISLDLQPAPPLDSQVSITEPKRGGTAEFPVTDIPGLHFTTEISCPAGSTKLIGIGKPVGSPAQNTDTLWAAFLTFNVRSIEPLLASKSAASCQIIQTSGSMHTAAFTVPEGLLEFSSENAETFLSGPRKPMPPQAWLETSGIKHAPGATATHAKGILTIVNTPDNIERVASLIDDALHRLPRTAAFTLHTLQAPAAFLRDLAHRTTTTADDAAMLAAVEAAVARGEARFIDTHFLETKPGSSTSHESVREHVYLSRFGTDAKGQPQLSFAMRPVGSLLKLDPVPDTFGNRLQIKLEHELHSAPPEQRREQFRDPASSKPFEMPVVDFHSARTVTDIPMTSGGTRLISLNRPTSHTEGDVLWATFLKCELVSHLSKVEPPPLEKKKTDPADPKAWNTRVYHVPPDFTASGGNAAEEAAMDRNKLVQRILEASGVPFPEGASVSYTLAADTMIVRNTNENLAIVDAYVESITKLSPKIVACTMHVLQGPGPLLRRLAAQAASKSEHRLEFDEMLAAVKAGSVQSLNTSRIETKSGTRATARQIVEHASITGVSINDRGEPAFEQKMREVGFRFELEPTIGADGVTMELTLAPEVHTAPPFEHREHIIDTQGRRLEFPLTDYFTSKHTCGISMFDGTARLLSLYKPTGKPEFEKDDILQAIFITCDLLRAGE